MKYKTRFFLFFMAMILFSLSSNFAHPVTPTIIQNLQLHDYMFGVALAMMQLANFIMSPFWGKINGYISSRVSLLIGCCGYGIAQIWFAYATSEFMIICARLFAGAFVGAIFVSFLTYVINVADAKDQPRYLTYSATISSVAGAFGYLVGGFLGEFSIKGTFIIQAITLIITGIMFYLVCLPDKQEHEAITYKQLAKDANPLKAFIDCRQFMTVTFVALFAINIFINFGNTGFDQAFNYFLKDQLHLTSAYNGIIKAAVGLVSFISNMTLCIWIINKTNVKRSLIVLISICMIASVGTVFAPGIGLFILFSILVYAGYSVSLPVLQNIVAEQADHTQKNLVMGFYNATKSLGSIAGSLTAGFIYSVNVKLPFVCTAIIYAIGVIAGILYYKRKKAFCIIVMCLILFTTSCSDSSNISDDSGLQLDNSYEPVYYTFSEIESMNASDILDESKLSSEVIAECFYSSEITDEVKQRIWNISYKENDNISLSELRYLRVLHKGFDDKTHIGELIVNQTIAETILEIMYDLYLHEYPIEKMVLIDEYNGDDEASMQDNNTSAFNYRVIANTTTLSKHSLGMAIDINPQYNPYVVETNGEITISPQNGAAYADRENDFSHKLSENDFCVRLFIEHDFTWGGNWNSVKDYQHFEK